MTTDSPLAAIVAAMATHDKATFEQTAGRYGNTAWQPSGGWDEFYKTLPATHTKMALSILRALADARMIDTSFDAAVIADLMRGGLADDR